MSIKYSVIHYFLVEWVNAFPPLQRDARKTTDDLNIFWLAEKRNYLFGLSEYRTNLNETRVMCIAGLLAPDQLPHSCPTVVKCA